MIAVIFFKKAKSQTLSCIWIHYIIKHFCRNIIMKGKSRFLEIISGDYRQSVAQGGASHCHENDHVTLKPTVLILQQTKSTIWESESV